MKNTNTRKMAAAVERYQIGKLIDELRNTRDALRQAATKRSVPGRTEERMRARRHLRTASRYITAAIRNLGNTQGLQRPAADSDSTKGAAPGVAQ